MPVECCGFIHSVPGSKVIVGTGVSIQPRMWLCVHNDLTSTGIVIALETEEATALCLL